MSKKKEQDSFKEFATSTVNTGIALGKIGLGVGMVFDTGISMTEFGQERFERYGISAAFRSTRKMGKAGFVIGALIGAKECVDSWAEKEKAKQQELKQVEREPGN
jgi:hypothetical protein